MQPGDKQARTNVDNQSSSSSSDPVGVKELVLVAINVVSVVTILLIVGAVFYCIRHKMRQRHRHVSLADTDTVMTSLL